jgi:glycosyltransferase involved in cell wall biosynthesis
VSPASGAAANPRRLILLAPIEPAPTGNGLAMRAELFRTSAPPHLAVETVVIPVAGRLEGPGRTAAAVVNTDPRRARAGAIALAAAPAWRDRLARVGSLPRAARIASPGLARDVTNALAPPHAIARADDVAPTEAIARPDAVAVHVMRAYLAPLGAAVAEQLSAAWTTLDLDEDDAGFARAAGDLEEAAAYDRLLEVFGPLFDGLAAASPEEARAIGERHGLTVDHLPNAVVAGPPRSGRRQAERTVSLLFVGNLTYPPNLEAARFLADEILPALSRSVDRRPHLKLVGPHDGRLDQLRADNVEVTGFLPDLDPVYAAADVVVVPLRSGAGTRIKLLEAFAHGVPTVASPLAAAGLEVTDRRHLLLADGPVRTAAAIATLLTEPGLADRLIAEAARLVRERYTVDAVRPLIRDFFNRARARADAAPAASRVSPRPPDRPNGSARARPDRAGP